MIALISVDFNKGIYLGFNVSLAMSDKMIVRLINNNNYLLY